MTNFEVAIFELFIIEKYINTYRSSRTEVKLLFNQFFNAAFFHVRQIMAYRVSVGVFLCNVHLLSKNIYKRNNLFNSIISFSFKNILILNEQIALHLILTNIHT